MLKALKAKEPVVEQTMPATVHPAVQDHINSIQKLVDDLDAARSEREGFRVEVEHLNAELRALRTELSAVKRMCDNETALRRHFERLTNDLATSLGNVQDQIHTIFDRVDRRKQTAVEEEKKLLQTSAPQGRPEDVPVPKFLLNQDKFLKDTKDGESR